MTATRIRRCAADLGLFLAHAVELEAEAAARYDELADSLEAHNNPEVARLFRELAGHGRSHRDQVAGIAAAHGPLPKVAPWDFDWGGAAESPEAPTFEDVHYLMTPHHALALALRCETRARDYYAAVAEETDQPGIARLARSFAEEEESHVALVRQWLDRFPPPPPGWDEDPDPPNYNE